MSAELMARAQAGDVDAFAEIYGKYRGAVYGYLMNRTRNRQIAEDLTQDAFVKALRGIGNWQWQGKDPGAWLSTIARHLLIDHHKHAAQRLRADVPDFDEFTNLLPEKGREGDPEAVVIARLRDTALLKALWMLTDEQRTCLVHRYVQGLSISETAEAMGRGENAVKALTLRGVRALSERLGGDIS